MTTYKEREDPAKQKHSQPQIQKIPLNLCLISNPASLDEIEPSYRFELKHTNRFAPKPIVLVWFLVSVDK